MSDSLTKELKALKSGHNEVSYNIFFVRLHSSSHDFQTLLENYVDCL